MIFIGIDIGVRHFGVVGLEWCTSTRIPEIRCIRLWDLEKDSVGGKKYTSFGRYAKIKRLWDLLESISYLWKNQDKTIQVLIEQQMSLKHVCNIQALKLAQHVLAFFLLRYPSLPVMEVSAKWKTQMFGHSFLKKADRKKWTVNETIRMLTEQNDVVSLDWLSTFSKKDDVCDCVMMILAFLQYHYPNGDWSTQT